ncbi:hypothetical protein [Phytohabitans rumicis]|uniref:Uncharacterized protein n=1 Tax=Phytohabitans rumicis TaxID=1076125 RepID=A0A6V8L4P7_9ACTN|nr:hypothetical protein [Phytohabitans rumicis]GFJ92243.1 hypothetical protein Prum_058850 [Phytohabitans rumicis]
MTQVGPTLTLRDIAGLAGVQRAVVSMWRRRPLVRGQRMPFPDAVPTADSVERFRRDEIVDWLARTGRGNNAQHHLDAPALSVPVGMSLEDLVTLLCLYAYGDSDLADLSAGERESLAERSDRGDSFLLSEVRQLRVDHDVPQYIDDLIEASRGLPEALARLEGGPAGRALGRRELTAEATTLVNAVVRASTMYLDPDGVPIVFTGSPPSLPVAIASEARELVVVGNGSAERAVRRRAAIHGLDVSDNAAPPLVHVLSVLGQEHDAALDKIDDLLLGLGKGEVGVVIGPASALCEPLRGDDERFRAKMLRPGRLVAAMRLPRGMWREAHRQALGIWVCTGDRTTDRPMVADLGAFPPADVAVEDVAADISGALTGDGRRAFRYLRVADLANILTGSPIVPQGVRAPRLKASSDDHLDRVQAAALVTAEPQPPLDVLVTAAPGTMVLRQRSLGELRDAGQLDVLRGSRIDSKDGVADGSVPVLSADGAMDDVALDPFDAPRLYPRASRTEPGDVIFVGSASPHARVDERGGALVASPSRILRLRSGAGVGPHTMAAIINHQASTSEWRTWSVPRLDSDAAEALEAALADASTYGAALRERQAALHDLITALIDGVAAGAVSVVPRSKV